MKVKRVLIHSRQIRTFSLNLHFTFTPSRARKGHLHLVVRVETTLGNVRAGLKARVQVRCGVTRE